MSATCSCDDPAGLLRTEAERFAASFPGLSVRFALVLGKRVSHLAGASSARATGDLRLDLVRGLVAFVSGPWKRSENELRAWADSLSGRI